MRDAPFSVFFAGRSLTDCRADVTRFDSLLVQRIDVDIQVTVDHFVLELAQRVGRRPIDDAAQAIIDSAVTGAFIELLIGNPLDGAAHMRAGIRKGEQLIARFHDKDADRAGRAFAGAHNRHVDRELGWLIWRDR